jgi:hypothetical protein
LITTDTRLEFFEAYRIYAQRWSLEVVFKEAKDSWDLGNARQTTLLRKLLPPL